MPSKFKPNTKPILLNPHQPEHMKRKIRAYNEIHQVYVPDRRGDKQELECSLYEQKYPANFIRKLNTVMRVKVPPGQFELDEEGTVDTE